MSNSTRSNRISSAIIIAGLILAVSIATAIATKAGYISADMDELANRMTGALSGAILVFFSNSAPKKLTPLSSTKGDPARRQAFQRFTAWVFVLSGVGFSITWLAAPIDLATPISIALVGGAFILVLIKCYAPNSTHKK